MGSDVTYSGIKIGRVEALAVAPENVSVIEVGISVAAGTPIAVDSKASLGSQGITGMKYIDISRGSEKVALRLPGDLIPPGDSMLDALSERAASIGEKLEELLVHLQNMTGTKAQARVQDILDTTAGILTDNRANIAAIVANGRKTSEELALLAQSGRVVMANANQMVLDLSAVTSEMRRTIGPKGQCRKISRFQRHRPRRRLRFARRAPTPRPRCSWRVRNWPRRGGCPRLGNNSMAATACGSIGATTRSTSRTRPRCRRAWVPSSCRR